jgi:uncharacterized protein (DUF924 family)
MLGIAMKSNGMLPLLDDARRKLYRRSNASTQSRLEFGDVQQLPKQGRRAAMEKQQADVLDFWFRELGPQDWFGAGDKLDPIVSDRFAELHQQAVSGALDAWTQTPLGRLALIIVLDQFSRHIYRGTERAFAVDTKAQQLTLEGLASNEDEQLTFGQRHFFYMPLMHAESLELQQLSVDRFSALKDFADDLLKFAQDHSDEVRRFGRFPLRNPALGRPSSSEEVAFLETAKPR